MSHGVISRDIGDGNIVGVFAFVIQECQGCLTCM